jgi:hypothetical protein
MAHVDSALILYHEPIGRLLKQQVAEFFEFLLSILVNNHIEAALSILFFDLSIAGLFTELLSYEIFN